MNFNEILEYQNGDLIWKKKISKKTVVGRVAGTVMQNNYVCLQINKKRLLAHRIVWEMFNGSIPPGIFVDHVDGNPRNNRIENLRLADGSQNNMNCRKRSAKRFKGVFKFKNKKTGYSRFVAEITCRRKKECLGYFKDEEAAARAYNKRALELFGSRARLNEV